MGSTAPGRNLERLNYAQTKRWLWLASLILPLGPLFTYGFYFTLDENPLVLAAPFLSYFGLVPILDAAIGSDRYNPRPDAEPQMARDQYYSWIAYSLIPAHYFLFAVTIWFVATQTAPLWSVLILIAGIGLINGNLINVSHELGHKTDRRNRTMAKLALGLSGYGHFTLDHNRNHHVLVSTPEDTASARLGESVYAFATRELPGALIGGWRHEIQRLKRAGRPVFHWRNEILQVYGITIATSAVLVASFGWRVLPVIIVHHFFSWIALTIVNYIEHYGLLREKRGDGKYEPCTPRHSWNANHLVSNILLLHLQRHSDHHANPLRPYQTLRDWGEAPSLPSGYPGCILLAVMPPLWFKVMDPRVIEWAGGDISKTNLSPSTRTRFA